VNAQVRRRVARPAAAAIMLVALLSLLTVGNAHASGCTGDCDYANDVLIDSSGRIVLAGGCEDAYGPGWGATPI
jgi:hypothetical protein